MWRCNWSMGGKLSFSCPMLAAVHRGLPCQAEAVQCPEQDASDVHLQGVNKKELVEIVKHALYASKICSYAQGLNIIKAKSEELGWDVDLGEISRIWKVTVPPM